VSPRDPFRVDQDARRRWLAARDLVRADCPRVVLPAVDVDPDDPRVPPAARRAQAQMGGRLTYAVAMIGHTISESGSNPVESIALRLDGAAWFVWRKTEPAWERRWEKPYVEIRKRLKPGESPFRVKRGVSRGGGWQGKGGQVRVPGCGLPLRLGITAWISMVRTLDRIRS
jgi:hypothetical protein